MKTNHRTIKMLLLPVLLLGLILGTAAIFSTRKAQAAAANAPLQADVPPVTTCAQRGMIDTGEYLIQNNEWNSTSTQCLTWTGGTAWSLTTANFNVAVPGVPATYPSIYKGCHWFNVPECTPNSGLPLLVSSLTSVRSTWNTIQVPGSYNVSYDLWTHSAPYSPGQPDGTEVMIWINTVGGPVPFGTLLGNANIAGYNMNIYGGNMPSWKVISYQFTAGQTAVTNLDILAIMKDAQTRGWMRSTDYLVGAEAGFEIFKGGQGLGTSSFSFNASSGPTPTPTTFVSPTVTRTPVPGTIRIEAGGAANFTDSSGNIWLADTGFTAGAGGVVDRGAIAIGNTIEDRIYQTERWGMTGFAYNVPNGSYQVNLHFAETYNGITAAGQRVFSANVEGTTIANIDVFAQAGGLNNALVKTANVTVTDGQLNISFAATVNNPEINGIEIIPTGTMATATATATVTKTLTPVNTPTRTVTATVTNTAVATMTPTRTNTPNPATVRIEAGGAANFTDSLGNLWLSDTGFTAGAGGVADRGNIAIANTVEDRVYQTERWGMTAFAYNVPNGTYQVNLHFAETYAGITAAGQRVFSANVEGTNIANIDVFAQAGGLNIALVKTATVTVADGQLNIIFTASANNPEINGIEIIPAGPVLTATVTATATKTLTPVNTSTRTVTPTITNTAPVTVTPTRTSTPSGVTVRIEAGGAANFVDSLGNTWLADTGFTAGAGGVADRGNIAIANTIEDRVYQTERWGMTAFTYPVPNGAYQVNLHFAETYAGITAAGQRVFSANVEGTTIANIDIFAQAGGLNKALVKSACVTVADGQLNITFAATVNNPEINGIEIISGATCPTPGYTGTPYSDTVYAGGAQPIPGRVKFAYYDFGGEGVAYHDMDAANSGSCGLNPCNGSYLNEFRKNESGDTSYVKFGNNPQIDDSIYTLVPQTANSLYLGWTVAGEWTKYTVNVQQAGLYSINIMYTKPQPGTFSFSFNNQDLTGPIDLLSTFNIADTLDWRNWHHWNKANGVAQVRLAAGVQVLTLNINMNGNFDYADFVFVSP